MPNSFKSMSRTSRRDFLKTTAALPTAGVSLTRSAGNQDRRSNLLMIIIDGQKADMLGCAGNSVVQTPHLDRLAQRGVRLDHSFSSHTVCMPSRASIMTGRYPSIHGVWANGVPLPQREVTLPQVLTRHGYKTAAAGKLHFEPQQSPDYPPDLSSGRSYYGFSEVHLAENKVGQEYLEFIDRNHPNWGKAARERASMPEEIDDVTWVVDQTIDFIERESDSAPFFAYCSWGTLIPPENPPFSFRDLYQPDDIPMPNRRKGELEKKPPHFKEVYRRQLQTGRYPDDQRYREIMVTYYAQMSFLDQQIGRIFQKLEDLNLMENTAVIVTSDHGLCLGDHWIWRHGPWLYDDVIRVPTIFYHPQLPAGRLVSDLVESVDLMPTLLELLDIPAPAGIQGRSVLPLLRGEPGARGKETVWVDDRDSPELLNFLKMDYESFRVMALRGREWKLVYYPGLRMEPGGELYHLREDPHEFVNLWNDSGYARVRQEYLNLLLDRVAQASDPLPIRTYEW